MFLRATESILGLGLLAYGLLEISRNPTWWAYTPVYLVPAILSIIQIPRNATWRTLSSLSIVAGGLYTSFLLWTFSSVESIPTIDLEEEAKNLPPVALGALLISFIRLTQDKISQPVHYVRSSIILAVALISFYAFISYF
ncbi:uncharacterized protein CELE_Y71F9B.1 [Caenorhabditis elegans]|uniref:Transmembrane protein n=1 Tax=Caenorhabditis elegans TaxID=6239 RepID=Q9N4G1_CAEEL|nr:Transmembrane protein [Caenorhabditis elegans]CCD70408.1 Transmembrane protein [Caenorhabditis elegans]|eukprot:NP_491039.1 Uncharacterized protein CELE_Y71F9B.1 [Caenorhabditis elegans]